MLDVIAILMLIAVLGSCVFVICDVLSDRQGGKQAGTNVPEQLNIPTMPTAQRPGRSKCHDCEYKDTDNVMYCIKSGCGLPPLPDNKGR